MASSVVMTARTDMALVRNHSAAARLRAATEAATTIVAFRLQSQAPEDHWLPNGATHLWSFDGQDLEISLYNEGSLIDLNGASQETLVKLFQAVELPLLTAQELAGAIIDWRDMDDIANTPGAETSEYKAAGRSYGSKNANFDSIAELRLVLGFNPEIISLISTALTTHGTGDTVLLDYAPPLVQTALGTNDFLTSPNQQQQQQGFSADTVNLGGPIYRIQVRSTSGGPMQKLIFRLGGSMGANYTIIERD